MTLDLDRKISAQSAGGKLWTLPGKDNIPTARELLIYALTEEHAKDVEDSFESKILKFELLERIKNPNPQEYSPKERDLLRSRMGLVFTQIEVVGQLHRLLS